MDSAPKVSARIVGHARKKAFQTGTDENSFDAVDSFVFNLAHGVHFERGSKSTRTLNSGLLTKLVSS